MARLGPRVFISYSQESDEHCLKVLQLSDRLRHDGIDCVIDQYEQAPPEGWPRWMAQNIDKADYVLIICTKTYYVQSKGGDGSSRGKGVKFETLLTYQAIVDDCSRNDKYVPVILEKNDKNFIPRPLKSFQFYNLAEFLDYESLYRRLTEQPVIQKPKIGEMKQLPVGINLDRTLTGVSNLIDRKQYRDSSKEILPIELKINRNFDDFSGLEQKKLLDAIHALLSIDYDLKISRIRPGSIIITLELPRKDTLKLYLLSYIGKLKKFNVMEATLLTDGRFTSLDDVIQEIMSHEPNPPIAGIKEKGFIVFVDFQKGYGLIEREKGGFVKFEIDKLSGSPMIGKSVSYPNKIIEKDGE